MSHMYPEQSVTACIGYIMEYRVCVYRGIHTCNTYPYTPQLMSSALLPEREYPALSPST